MNTNNETLTSFDQKTTKQDDPRLILVIDDESAIRKLFKIILEREGFAVILAADGVEGLALYKEKKPALIITDLIMPEKEGIELIIELKKQQPAFPIVAISGGGRNTPHSYLHIAKLLGASFVLEKPVAKETLLKAVNSLI